MKNLPEKIYLQVHDDSAIEGEVLDWNDLFKGSVTWSTERIYPDDVEYILSPPPEQSDSNES